jgi:2-oxo-3-hexenedioate decarboxylase
MILAHAANPDGSNFRKGQLSADPEHPPLAAGEIVGSGTLTRALPVKAGQTWTTKLEGIALEGISLRFC